MRILDNQYLPDGFGKTAKTYWYIQRKRDKYNEYYCHDGKWRKKAPIDMAKYVFRTFEDAEKCQFDLIYEKQ